MAMEVLWSFHILMVLISVHAAQSHRGSHRLFCTNDYVKNVSCTLNTSTVGPHANCWISGVINGWISSTQQAPLTRKCKLQQHGNSLPGCSFDFENKKFSPYQDPLNISLECNGTLVEILKNYHPKNHIKLNSPGAPNISSNGTDLLISWSLGSHTYLKSFEFQVQIRENNQMWKEASVYYATEQKLRLPVRRLKAHCYIRVRVKPRGEEYRHWSHWSPASSWVEVETVAYERWHALVLLVILCVIAAVVVVALYRFCKTMGLLKSKPAPNPSKYFHTLHSVHEGNLKKWLNPLSVSESFFTAHPCDQISPVEVCEDWAIVPSTSPSSSSINALIHPQSYPSAGSDTSGIVNNSSSSSFFSNRSYFLSSSSGGSAQTDPTPAYFTYHDDFHNLQPPLCPSLPGFTDYESLKREPQSPDSGFGIGHEAETEEEGDMEGDGEVLVDNQRAPFLILPVHLPSQMCAPSSPPSPPTPPIVAQMSSDSQHVEPPATAASDSSSAWLVPGGMCRSSSMPVEPSKTGYLTLKELHLTFSNKSI